MGGGTIALLAALADPDSRPRMAEELARHLGAEDLVIFVVDAEIGAHLPAIGFPKTLPDGRTWRDLVQRCLRSRELEEGEVPYPGSGAVRRARALAYDVDCVLVLVGGQPERSRLEEMRPAMPLLAALLAAERRAALGESQALVARSISARAEALTASLAASQSDLHNALHRLQASEQSLSVTLRSIGDAVITTDRDGCITFMNPVAEALTGWGLEHAISRALPEVFRIVNEHTRAPAENPVAQVMRSGDVVELANHICLVRRDGSTISIDDSAAPIRHGTGDLVGVVLVFRDVTARRRAEQQLAAQHEHAQLAAAIGVALTEKSGLREQLHGCAEAIVRRLDAAFARVWTLAAGSNVLELQASAGVYTHLDGGHARVPVGALKIGKIAQERAPHVTNDLQGDPRISDKEWARREGMLSFAGYPLIVEERLVGVIALFAKHHLDELSVAALASIADQLAVAIDRDAASRAMKEAVIARETLLAIVSHDLRGPLGSIHMAGALLQRSIAIDDGPALSVLASVRRSTERMTRMIDDLLDFASIDAGRLSVERSPLAAAELVQEAVEIQRLLSTTSSPKIELAIATEHVMLSADRERMLQVFANLIGNAVKFTPESGTVSIRFNVRDGEAIFSIVDTGPGMAAEVLAYAFDPYRQAKETARLGHGLGLFIAKGIVEAHDGRIWAESQPGKGSAFFISLPIAS